MTWVKLKDRKPSKRGWYYVVKFIPGTERTGFFVPVPPQKQIIRCQWKEQLKLEEMFVDRVVYIRFNCFLDEQGLKQKPEEILYWYELDPIPEEA